ncbi:hypothetical protein [Heliorestis convoluta]|uniref:Uncharacterized protein n=1 Tax=Heliorestis convoluta TaxID=356322 RepID=A0A5Q2N753_9FIRM|nr:hypothetical protein [Heliorestis convoluta]QGG49386.1 hypothetical protein FTV88_3321 [Heliorestis convoluta]
MNLLQDKITKEKALQKLDEEHRRYRQVLEAAYALSEEMMQAALEPLHKELQAIRGQVETIKTMAQPQVQDKEHYQESEQKAQEKKSTPRGRNNRKKEEKSTRSRIRWGNTEEEIRKTVFEQLQSLESRGKEITITTIKTEVPSMMRYVYGDKALFKGIGELMEEYEEAKSSDTYQEDSNSNNVSKNYKEEQSTLMSRVVELPAMERPSFNLTDSAEDTERMPFAQTEQETVLYRSE